MYLNKILQENWVFKMNQFVTTCDSLVQIS
jgi:hypothetical protein